MNVVQKGRKLEVDGVLLAKLSPNDRAEIAEEMKADLRKAMLENLTRAQITGEAYFNEIDAFDQEAWGDVRWMGAEADKENGTARIDGVLDSYKGQAKIIERAGRKQHGEKWPEEYEKLEIGHNETWALALLLSTNLKLRSVPTEEKKEDAKTGTPERPSVAAA